MPAERPRPRRALARPGRLVAVAAAVLVCVLSVSGAFGVSYPGTEAASAQHGASTNAAGGTTGAVTHHPTTNRDRAEPTPTAIGRAPVVRGGSGSRTSREVALPASSGEARRIVFDISAQRVWLVDGHHAVERTYLVSGSRFHNLRPGTYHVYSRSRHATAYNSDETMSYMVRFTHGRTPVPIGFHSIPVYPNGDLVEPRSGLGAPASDGCIRQWITDAHALWKFAPNGTTVVVLA
ncbi:MAG: hypothetical protein QOI06_3376 [Nocardioidaceae bacterium]|jgi:lipoprotein-anchoring transpeptidase ErfK/SrfK|nr:hypothetical protein [Nocardioidaceae bacterium]